MRNSIRVTRITSPVRYHLILLRTLQLRYFGRRIFTIPGYNEHAKCSFLLLRRVGNLSFFALHRQLVGPEALQLHAASTCKIDINNCKCPRTIRSGTHNCRQSFAVCRKIADYKMNSTSTGILQRLS